MNHHDGITVLQLTLLDAPTGQLFGGGNAATVRTFDQGTARYRLSFFVVAFNLANRANYFGYSGTMISPFFGKPTTVRDMRKVDVGINLNFESHAHVRRDRHASRGVLRCAARGPA